MTRGHARRSSSSSSSDSSEDEGSPLSPSRSRSSDHSERRKQSFGDRITSLVQEPLTPLTQLLLVVVLTLLLLSSVFIGLFAGAQHKLNVERGRFPSGTPREPVTVTATTTAISTETDFETLTTTAVSTRTRTRTATETDISTWTDVTTATKTMTETHGGSATATKTETFISYTTSFTTSISTATETETRIEHDTETTTRVITSTERVPVPGPTGPPSKDLPCMTTDCILLSASILSSLDTSQDPCENFYDYATGGWRKAHPLPDDKGAFGAFNELGQQNKEVIKNVLTNKDYLDGFTASGDKAILIKLRDYYESCTDEDRLDEIGSVPLKQLIRTLRKLFREEDTKLDENVDYGESSRGLTAALAFLHSRDVDSLFTFNVEGDVGEDPNYMVLWFSQPSLGLPSKEYYNDDSSASLYRSVVERIFFVLAEDEQDELAAQSAKKLLINNAESKVWPPWPWPPWEGDDDDDHPKRPGGGEPSERAKHARKLAKKVFRFEKSLAEAGLDLDVLNQDPIATYNPVPLYELTRGVPQVHFPTYFAAFTPRTYPERVILTSPDYMKSLARILADTPDEVLESYLVLRAALTLAPKLSKSTPVWQAHRVLEEAITGIKPGAFGDRSEFCIGQVESALGFAAGRYFVRETFGGDSRTKSAEVIKNIVAAFKESLYKLDWMDQRSKRLAAEKADNIRVKVGYPTSPNTMDPESIEQYYRAVKVSKKTFFENALSAAQSEKFKAWLQLGRKRNVQSWEMYPSMVNAYFNPPANEIVFPAGILRPPFFQVDWPAYLAYGAFGHVAAHELTHAFDSAGRLYNQNGQLEEWWSEETSEGFKRRQKCIVDQFSKYYVDDPKGGHIHLNGNLTSGENIGDSGLIQAYRAWKANFGESFHKGGEFALPGLSFTREQLFFISFARIWAQNIKPAQLVQRVRTDPHSPGRFRVEGTVSNIPEFARAFKCPPGAKLNPPKEDKCLFW